eukprot:5739842-Pyramimonas_sp.AAC.1
MTNSRPACVAKLSRRNLQIYVECSTPRCPDLQAILGLPEAKRPHCCRKSAPPDSRSPRSAQATPSPHST